MDPNTVYDDKPTLYLVTYQVTDTLSGQSKIVTKIIETEPSLWWRQAKKASHSSEIAIINTWFIGESL